MQDQQPPAPPQSQIGPALRVALFTVLLVAAIIFAVFVLARVRHVVQMFVIAFILAVAINPAVSWLERHRVQRPVSVITLLVLLFTAIGTGVWALAPMVGQQAADFAANAPAYLEELRGYVLWLQQRVPALGEPDLMDQLQAESSVMINRMWEWIRDFFQASVIGVIQTIFIVFLAVFMLLHPKPLVRGMLGLFPRQWQPEVERIGSIAVGKLEAWIQGSLLLMLIIGAMYTVLLVWLDVPYALLWGVFGGLLEVVPTVGPIISAIPPILLGLSISPTTGLWVLVGYVVIQQIESNVLVPLIMSNKVRLHPVSLLFFLLVMATFFGIFGAIIATPVAALLKLLYLELYYRRLHGSLPPEEEADPIRLRLRRRFAHVDRHHEELPPPPEAGAGEQEPPPPPQ
jgi:predicted PurR-regulated permease PerM